jgi:hypothetical protein
MNHIHHTLDERDVHQYVMGYMPPLERELGRADL